MRKGPGDGSCPSGDSAFRWREVVYLLFFSMLFGFRAVGGHDGHAVYPYVLLAGMAFFACKVFCTEHTVFELLWMGLFLGVSLLVYARTGEKGLLLDLTMMLGMKGVSQRRVFRSSAVLLGVAMAVNTFLAVFGIVEDVHFGAWGRHRWPDLVIRHSLGYPHMNTLLTTYVILMMLCMYLIGRESRARVLRSSVLLLLGSFYFYLYCDSTTGLLISAVYLLLNGYFQFVLRYRAWERAAIWMVYPLVNLFVLGGALLYRPRWMEAPGLLSFMDRFRLSSLYLSAYPIKWFGQRIVIPDTELYGLDMSQLHLLLNLGLAAFVMVSALYGLVLRDMLRERDRGALAIILMLTVMGISDPLLYNLSCKNLIFVFMGMAWYRWTGSWEARCPRWMRHRVCLLPWGGEKLPASFRGALERGVGIARKAEEGLWRGGRWIAAALAVSVAVAGAYGGLALDRVGPVERSLEAGMYDHLRLSVSIGVWCFSLSMALRFLMCARAAAAGDQRGSKGD